MALPLRDNLEPRRIPWVTFTLIGLNCLVFLFVQPSAFQGGASSGSLDRSETERLIEGDRFAMRWGVIPCEIRTGQPVIEAPDGCEEPPTDFLPRDKNVHLAMATAMFLHGNVLHLAGNMLFLWVFGRNVEDRLGRGVHLLHHLVGGLAASATSVISSLDSATPMIGASGAIAATMGAYLVC